MEQEQIDQLCSDLLVVTSPETTGQRAQDWNERIYQIAKKTDLKTERICWNSSPLAVAESVVKECFCTIRDGLEILSKLVKESK